MAAFDIGALVVNLTRDGSDFFTGADASLACAMRT
jgi:hypothetical protein